MSDLDRVKYGCGGAVLAIAAAFALMAWWYSRPTSPEEREKNTADRFAAAVQEAQAKINEASACLARREYDKSYAAWYYAFNSLMDFRSDLQPIPGQNLQEWMNGHKSAWRSAINKEFDRRIQQFDSDPLESADSLDSLLRDYRRDYPELEGKYEIRKADIVRHRIAAASKTVYLDTAGILGEAFETQCLEVLRAALRSRWGASTGLRLSFQRPNSHEERDGALLVLEPELSISRARYVSSRHGQETVRQIAERIRITWRAGGSGKTPTNWHNLPLVEVFRKAPASVDSGDLHDTAAEHEKQLLAELDKQLKQLPVFQLNP